MINWKNIVLFFSIRNYVYLHYCSNMQSEFQSMKIFFLKLHIIIKRINELKQIFQRTFYSTEEKRKTNFMWILKYNVINYLREN